VKIVLREGKANYVISTGEVGDCARHRKMIDSQERSAEEKFAPGRGKQREVPRMLGKRKNQGGALRGNYKERPYIPTTRGKKAKKKIENLHQCRNARKRVYVNTTMEKLLQHWD